MVAVVQNSSKVGLLEIRKKTNVHNLDLCSYRDVKRNRLQLKSSSSFCFLALIGVHDRSLIDVQIVFSICLAHFTQQSMPYADCKILSPRWQTYFMYRLA